MGTRMKSARPKVMHAVAGLPILGHVIAACRAAGCARIVVVTHAAGDEVRAYAASLGAESVIQEQQLGTGHAAACAVSALLDFSGDVLVTYGDMPLVQPEALQASFAARAEAGMAMVGFEPKDPAAYGRMVMDASGLLERIVEFKDASPEEKKIKLCNAGILCADALSFFLWAGRLENSNAQSEYYLTDIPEIARREGVGCAVTIVDEIDVMGVNSRSELANAEAQMQQRLRKRAMEAGVGMQAPETVFLSYDTALEADVQVGPYVVFGPGVAVKRGTEILSHSHLEGAAVGEGARIGPFARLRPGTVIEDGAHIGNFVETKKARIGKGAKANHLSYLGDARVGAGANIGAGTITCNYDGFDKYETDIGAGAFIGSNSSLVAPVTVANGAYTAAGSVITKDVSSDSLAVTRAEQREVPGWAEKFRAKKRAEKAKKS